MKVITATTSDGIDKDKAKGGVKLETVTLLVTPEQAERLAYYNSTTNIHFALVYRGDTDKADAFIKIQDDYSISSIRRQIGIVHQDPIIFDGSIRYNLVFHDDPVNDEQIYDALQKAALYDYINTLPDGLDTIIGVHGQGLSGGQKQRIAIARIFLRNPKIVIFDEATSSLDNISENVIKESWDSLCENRTIIVIAHRLSTVMNSEKIFVLDNGVIASEGTHEELLHKSETYQQLFSEQQ